jgi:ABC-2 type transport system ATP-binding protein
MDHAIEAEGLEKTYPGRRGAPAVRALDGLSFNVEEGTVFGLLGPNGAGKSTAVKILTTLSRADAGSARVVGLDVRREPGRVRCAIGGVAQRSGFDRDATGRENIVLQGHLYGMDGAQLKARAQDLMERFGIADAADRLARTYSGGMQRRLDVAIGLVHRPQVLFLDEPTTGLDPEARAEMWREIEHLTGEGLTILLTTHYLEEADRLAKRLAIIDRGRVVVEGTPAQLKAEMRGDAVRVSLCEAESDDLVRDELVQEVLAIVAGVRDVVVEGCQLHARADDGAKAVPLVLSALEARGVGVSAVTVARPSLDDVYLRHTGRSFLEVDSEGGANRVKRGSRR